jgi:hypothetical protein
VLAIAEDPVDPDLLFVGTEFGLFFTVDGGKKWVQLKGGLPTIAVRDLAIQKREDDLVLATFGRGFYVLDDYTPLRRLKPASLETEALLFSTKDALMYIQSRPLGGRGKSFQGEAFFTADNPPFGAVFTYYLKDTLKTRKQKRQDAEKAAEKAGKEPPLPTRDELRREEDEQAPSIIVTVTDVDGHVVRRLTGASASGIHRVAWDLREPAPTLAPPRPAGAPEEPFFEPPSGPLVLPGRYKVSIAKRVDGVTSLIAGPQEFTIVADGAASLPAPDRAALLEFQQKVARLQRAVNGAVETANGLRTRLVAIGRALQETPAADAQLTQDALSIDKRNDDIIRALSGDTAARSRSENTPPSIIQRVMGIVGDQRMSTSRPTQTQIDQYSHAAREFEQVLANLRALIEGDLTRLEKAMEAAGAPWTPGRIPEWKDR